MFCQVNEYLRRGWRCQHLPSGQKGRAHISIVLTALHAGTNCRHCHPGGPGTALPCTQTADSPASIFSSVKWEQESRRGLSVLKKKILGLIPTPSNPRVPSGCGKPETPVCYHQVYSAQDAQCLSAVWLRGQNCARLVGVPGEDRSPAIPWEVASPHSPAVLRPVRSRQGLPLSRLYPSLGYPFIHSAWGLDLCAPPSVSFLGQFRTCAESPRPGLGTLPPGRSPSPRL